MIDAFLKYITTEVQLSAPTVEAYRSDLRQWEKFATSDRRFPLCPETTTLSDLRLWVASLARVSRTPRTIRRKIQSLRAFFRYLMKYHGLKANPAMDLQVPKVPHDLPVYVRTEEMSAMLDTEIDNTDYESVRNRLIIDMLYDTGLRCSELIGLTDGNVDTAKGELKVHGKRNKDRIVPFGPELCDMITCYRRLRGRRILPSPRRSSALPEASLQHRPFGHGTRRSACCPKKPPCAPPHLRHRHAQRRCTAHFRPAAPRPPLSQRNASIYTYILPRSKTKLSTSTSTCTKKRRIDYGTSHSRHPLRCK